MFESSDCIETQAERTWAQYAVAAILVVPPLLLCVSFARADDPAQLLRERYLDPTGTPSQDVYAQVCGIAPVAGSEESDLQVVFKLTYLQSELSRLIHAQPIATDCYLVHTKRYSAPFRAESVWDGRVYLQDDRLVVAAYSENCEQVVGYCDESGVHLDRQRADDSAPLLKLNGLQYNPFTGKLWQRQPGGIIEVQHRYFMPLPLINMQGEPLPAEFAVVGRGDGRFDLIARSSDATVVLASCAVSPQDVIRRSAGYTPELGEGCQMITREPTVVLEVRGALTAQLSASTGPYLIMEDEFDATVPARPRIEIDGRFDDWRNVSGIGDPPGDCPGYLAYNPDTDLLEFKVASDREHLYFYSRVVGKHGHTAACRDRYYFYVYIDADRNSRTGYVPTRDDDCYFGVALGDDCESQFEFVGGRFVKTFYGFTGAGTEREVLSGKVTLAPSWYSRHDPQGKLRDRYKVEYIRQGDEQQITEDFAEGTSEDIVIALSPDGSECEMRAALSGFLRDERGQPIIGIGQQIDLAVGVEASGEIHGNSKWGADSTAVLRGFLVAE